MTRLGKLRPIQRIHAYAASFGEDFARELILEHTLESSTVLDPFVGAGTTALESALLNRNAIGIDVDPLACKISRVLTSRIDVTYLTIATNNLKDRLHGLESLLALDPKVFCELKPGSTFVLGAREFQVPNEPAIAYWFDPSHMATLAIIRQAVADEVSPVVREAFEIAISSCIIRKWPNTLSYAMDIDHTRPHRPNDLRAQPVSDQFKLFVRVLTRVKDTIVAIQERLSLGDASVSIIQGDSIKHLTSIESSTVDFVLTSPPYLNAIDYPRAHKFSQWWLSPEIRPLGRSEYMGLRQSAKLEFGNDDWINGNLLKLLRPFEGTPVYRNIARYVTDLFGVLIQLRRICKTKASVAFVVANNVIKGEVLQVANIIEELMMRAGFSEVNLTPRNIKNTRRRYPFGKNGFAGPMKSEYVVTGIS